MNFKLSASGLSLAASFFFATLLCINPQVKAQIGPQWILDTTVSNVKCYHMITKCGNEDVVVLKFVNEHSASARISWDARFNTNLSQPMSHPAGRQTISIPWGEYLATDCSGTEKALYTVASDIDSTCTQINQFSFSNIAVQ